MQVDARLYQPTGSCIIGYTDRKLGIAFVLFNPVTSGANPVWVRRSVTGFN